MRIPILPGLLACLSLFLLSCDNPFTTSDPVRDFNPLPDADEYVFQKWGRHAFGGWASWECSTTVHRTPLKTQPPDTSVRRLYQDSNSVRCLFEGLVQIGDSARKRDTVVFRTSYSDTLEFRATRDTLYIEGFERFQNVFLPARYVGQATFDYWENQFQSGFIIPSKIIGTFPAALPRRNIPEHPDASSKCTDLGRNARTYCKRWNPNFSFDYFIEYLDFLDGEGLYNRFSGGGDGMNLNSYSAKVRLLRKVKNGSTTAFD